MIDGIPYSRSIKAYKRVVNKTKFTEYLDQDDLQHLFKTGKARYSLLLAHAFVMGSADAM
jgi:hypothetical protein